MRLMHSRPTPSGPFPLGKPLRFTRRFSRVQEEGARLADSFRKALSLIALLLLFLLPMPARSSHAAEADGIGLAASHQPPAASPGTPAAPAASPPGLATSLPASPVVILEESASWNQLSGLFLGQGGAGTEPFAHGSLYVIAGRLENRGSRDLDHVVLRYELLDSDGKVVWFEEGNNRAAETLVDGRAVPQGMNSLPAGAIDHFRMAFFADEIPGFERHRVSVVEAVPLQ